MNHLSSFYLALIFLLSTFSLSASYTSIKLEIRRTFDRPIVIDVKAFTGQNEAGDEAAYYFAATKVYEGMGMGELGGAHERTGKTLTAEEFAMIANRLDQLNLWKIFQSYPADHAVADGSVWIIEASRAGGSFRFAFSTPTSLPEAADIVQYFREVMRIAESPVDISKIY